MLAAIFDLVRSRRLGPAEAGRLRETISRCVEQVEVRMVKELVAKPALTAGDSVEFLTSGWKPVVFFFHLSRSAALEFRVGLGAGRVDVLREFADECDGPAFWSARSALEDLDRREARGSLVNFELGEGADCEDARNLELASLSISLIDEMPLRKALYCLHRVWFNERVSDIAMRFGVSRGNVSKVLRGSSCFVLAKLVGGA